MDDNISFSGVTIDFDRMIKKKKRPFNEIVISSSAVMKRQDKTDRLEIVDRFDLLKVLERNIFQQEMKFLFLFLKTHYSGEDGLNNDWFYGSGKQILTKDEGLNLCLLNSHEVHLNLNTSRD